MRDKSRWFMGRTKSEGMQAGRRLLALETLFSSVLSLLS